MKFLFNLRMIALGAKLWLAVMIGASSTSLQAREHRGCTIIFAASGGSYETFTDQVQQLSAHLRRQNIRLIDLNHWQVRWPYIATSGRDKAQLRRFHAFTGFGKRAKAQAVLLDAEGVETERYTNTLDLVDMLMDCPDR